MLKAGFIGLGRMGITHFSILNTHPSVQIVSVCDSSRAMLNILKKYVQVKTYSDYKRMISEEDLDFVVISTPTNSHSEILNYAIEQELHMFAEKPFAMSPEYGEETLKRLGEHPLVNQVGYVNRFNEVFMEVKNLINSGLIGDVKNFVSEMYGATVLKDAKKSWRGQNEAGGGCMYEFASHCIDLVVYLVGVPDKVVGSIMQSLYSSNVEDLVSSTFVYNRGCTGNILVNWSDATYRKPANIVKILGTKGKIIADKHAYKIFLKEPAEAHGLPLGWTTRYITDFAKNVRFYVRGNEFTRQLDYFVNCMKRRQVNNISSFAEAYKTDIIMGSIRQDAARALEVDSADAKISPIMSRRTRPPSLWNKIVRAVEGRNA